MNSIYLKEVIKQTPRLLGLLNRNPLSKTYGCFDRQYWHYNSSDFACARLQEAVLTLALLYQIEERDNPYYKNKQILDWINAGLKFWEDIQEKNGSFNEWYPKENSFVATAFSSYAVSETILQLGENIVEKERLLSALKKSGNWLLKRNETRAMNQEAGAAISLYNIYLLTNDNEYKESAGEKVKFLINNQTDEGWFWEYGGADIGYLSLAIDYLAKYYQKTQDNNLLKTLEKAIDFVSYFIHPDLTSGGDYGSRNTEYLIPHGFEFLSKELPNAALISAHIRKALENKVTISPISLDDRYLCYISYTYLQAYLDSQDLSLGSLPAYKKKFIRNFQTAGLWIYSDDNLYLITNYKKGGVSRIFFKKSNNALYDSGLVLISDGKKFTSNWFTNINQYKISEKGIEIKGNLWKLPENVMTPMKNILLRIFQITIGGEENINAFMKKKFRDKLITNANKTNVKFLRRINITEDGIQMEDVLKNTEVKKLITGLKVSYTYTPSSRYFQIPELGSIPFVYSCKAPNKEITIIRKYNLDGRLIDIISKDT